MGYLVLANDEVWEGYASIPDRDDRAHARAIMFGLVDDPFPVGALTITTTGPDGVWLRYVIVLPSGRGFVSYSPVFTEDGEPAVLLWPVVWFDV